jgi:hypothetical protein
MPIQLQKYVESGAWRDAIEFYMKTINIIRKHHYISSFAMIERESNVQIQKIMSNLRSLFSDHVSGISRVPTRKSHGLLMRKRFSISHETIF